MLDVESVGCRGEEEAYGSFVSHVLRRVFRVIVEAGDHFVAASGASGFALGYLSMASTLVSISHGERH